MRLARRNSDAARAWAAKRRESQDRATALRQERSSTESRCARGSADLQSISTDQLSLGTATPHVQQKFQEHTQHNFSAAHSNEANAEYVEDFRVGMADMYLALEVPRSTIITKPTAGAIKIGRHGHDHLARYQSCQPSTTQPLAEQRRSLVRGRSGGASLVPDPPHRRIGPNERVGARVESGIPRGSSDVGLASSGGSAGKILLGAERVAKDVRHPSSVRCFGLAAEGWYKGPLDPAGKLSNLSDRNLLCLSVRGDEAVFGCADHALYCVDLSRGTKARRLYGTQSNRRAGHSEWVSAVVHTSQGDIVSGGMDGKLCLWPAQGGDPGEVQAHAGSISAIKADSEGRVASCGYGGAVRIWDCRGSRGRRVRGSGGSAPRLCGELSDVRLPAPCMDFAWDGGNIVTGHRDGRLGLYDLETGAMVLCVAGAHRGHVTNVNSLASLRNCSASGSSSAHDSEEVGRGQVGDNCFVTGGQDGFIRIWDTRVGERGACGLLESEPSCASKKDRHQDGEGVGMRPVMESPAHRGLQGVGAVGGVIGVGEGTGRVPRLASFGADNRVCVLEARGGQGAGAKAGIKGRVTLDAGRAGASTIAIEHVFDEHRNFIYCMDFVPSGKISHGGGEGFRGNGAGQGGLLVTGGGGGTVLVHDVGSSMRLLYGLGCCMAGAVRCVSAQGNRLAVAGDDGNAIVYDLGGSRDEDTGVRNRSSLT